jgi:hypothetical protein
VSQGKHEAEVAAADAACIRASLIGPCMSTLKAVESTVQSRKYSEKSFRTHIHDSVRSVPGEGSLRSSIHLFYVEVRSATAK